MPLYEYECEACAHRFEVIQKFSDAPISVCPKCGGAVHKLLSSPAIQFKGSGFYLTDYRSESYKEGAKKDDAGASSPSSASPSNAASPPSSTSSASDAPKADSKASTPSKPAKKSGGKSKR